MSALTAGGPIAPPAAIPAEIVVPRSKTLAVMTPMPAPSVPFTRLVMSPPAAFTKSRTSPWSPTALSDVGNLRSDVQAPNRLNFGVYVLVERTCLQLAAKTGDIAPVAAEGFIEVTP
jgi:hypothetical protein